MTNIIIAKYGKIAIKNAIDIIKYEFNSNTSHNDKFIAKSHILLSLENLFNILPDGFVSKYDIGDILNDYII